MQIIGKLGEIAEKILGFVSLYVILQPDFNAQMAELVDASDSKSGIGNNVQVRFLFWAQNHLFQVVFLCRKVLSCKGFQRFHLSFRLF